MPENRRLVSDGELEFISGGAYNGSVFLYTVQRGDTLSILAHRFGTTVATLIELNEIQSAESVQPGRKLLIPLRA